MPGSKIYDCSGNVIVVHEPARLTTNPLKAFEKFKSKGPYFDTFAFITQKEKECVAVVFIDYDGTEEVGCGNGLIAAARQLTSGRCFPTEIMIETRVAKFQVSVKSSSVSVLFSPPRIIQIELDTWLVDAHVPHAVVQLSERQFSRVDDLYARSISTKFANSLFWRAGPQESICVTFFKVGGETNDAVHVLTRERHINRFTGSCGTGAISVAAVLQAGALASRKRYVMRFPGGPICVEGVAGRFSLTGFPRLIWIASC